MERNCTKMERNFKIKVLNIISGSNKGGAENFFERLSISLEKDKNLQQKVLIRENKKRFSNLKENLNDIEQIKFFNFYNPFCHIKINKTLKDFKPNIVLSWMNRASQIIPFKKYNNEVRVGRLGGYYKLKNYISCDYLITNTLDLKKYVCEKGWDPKKVEFIPNFVNKNNNSKIEKENNSKIILCLGRFHVNKGIDIIIKAMTNLPEYILWIVGDGGLKNKYKKLIQDLRITQRTKIFNWTDNISQYLNVANVLVCPSIHEPFGNIIIDGWAHKVPVIASDVEGPSILINDGFNGLKFEKGNVAQLAELVRKVIVNKNISNKISKNGYLTYQKFYTEDVITKKYINFFRRISF